MLKINTISITPDQIILHWSGADGYGQYALIANNEGNIIEGYSEYMDNNNDKSFIKELLLSLVDKIKIVE